VNVTKRGSGRPRPEQRRRVERREPYHPSLLPPDRARLLVFCGPTRQESAREVRLAVQVFTTGVRLDVDSFDCRLKSWASRVSTGQIHGRLPVFFA
jgi:hypothetical protein